MTEYLITARIRTDREPREDTNWKLLTEAVRDAVFKMRPALEVTVLGMKVEQVTPIVTPRN